MRLVRRLFSTSTRTADSNFLRREIASRMHERLALVKISPERILDLGCGDGADLSPLQVPYPRARVVGIDASGVQLAAASSKHQAATSSVGRLLNKWLPARSSGGASQAAGLIGGDFGQLPLAHSCADLIWSNLALHWHPQPDHVFAEWRRVLRVDGLLMFSCFGPDTFREVRDAFAGIDDASHALSFVDMHDYGDMLINAGFSTPVMDMESLTVTYDSVERLLSDVRAWGGNPLLTRRAGLLGRRAWHRVKESFESRRRADGKLPLTFEVIYGHAFRPAARTTSAGETIVRLDMPRKGGR